MERSELSYKYERHDETIQSAYTRRIFVVVRNLFFKVEYWLKFSYNLGMYGTNYHMFSLQQK